MERTDAMKQEEKEVHVQVDEQEIEEQEPVLLVPPTLTKSSYKILLEHDCVARPWHPEGRYGSRTHKVDVDGSKSKSGSSRGKIGLPLLKKSKDNNVDCIIKFLQEKEEEGNGDDDAKERIQEDRKGKLDVDEDNKDRERASRDVLPLSLRKLLLTPGVELIYETPVKSNREPKKVEKFDATVHPELMSLDFPFKMKEFIFARNNNKRRRRACGSSISGSHSDSASNSGGCSRKGSSAFTFCELFAGIGGFGIALEKLGGTCIFASEIYEPSKKVFRANLDVTKIPGGYIWGDIWDITSTDIPSHDILVAGFPCQPFSNLGLQPGLDDAKTISGRKFGDDTTTTTTKQEQKSLSQYHHSNPDDTCTNMSIDADEDGVGAKTVKGNNGQGQGRGQLFTQIVRILRDCKPKAFLLENVPGLLTTPYRNGTTAWQKIESELISVGYDVSFEIVSSRGMTAQARKRLYIVGILKQQSSDTDGIHRDDDDDQNEESSAATSNKKRKTISKEPFQFPFIPDLGLRAADVLHTPKELTNTTSLHATGIPDSLVHILRQSQDKSYTAITPEALFRISDAQLDQLRNRSKTWKPAKLAWDNKTLDTIDSHYGVTVGKGNSQLVPSPAPHHPRRFTPRECARIMGFRNDFILGDFDERRFNSQSNIDARFNGYIKEQYYMLGNAVCPPVISVLAGAILDQVLDHDGEDWVDKGLWTGIQLSLDAISNDRSEAVYNRLLSCFDKVK